jgi:Leucine-rich repeat (LRR) protein
MAKANLRLLIISALICYNPVSSATFENVSVILTWRSGTQLQKNVTIRSDNTLRSHVGEFGEILIQNQNVPRLGENSISNLVKVTHLHLTNSKLREIKPGAFSNLPLLTDLNLSGNLLEEIPNGIFANLKFQTLYLDNNRISTIGDSAFNNLQMAYLFIDDNKISEWKSDWFSGTPLESVSMTNNHLKELPRLAFEFLWHLDPARDVILRNVALGHNGLQHVDPFAFEGIKMVFSLNLQNNLLTYLEPGLFDFTERIDLLDLSNNRITQLYFEAFRKTKVSQLNVHNNLIECISTDIFNTTELETVNVGSNPISCGCVKTWMEWYQRSEKPEVQNFNNVKKKCRSSSSGIRSSQVLFAFVFVYFLV